MQFAILIMAPPGSPEYIHGEIYREIADALHFALLALGHDSIVLQPYMFGRYSIEPPKNPIMYNLEPIDHRLQWWTMPGPLAALRRYPMWDYSQANIDRMKSWRFTPPTHVPLGYVPELSRIAPANKDVDVLFYGALNDRRQAALDALRARGLRVEWLYGAYGAYRDAWIARSKIVINIHQYEAQPFEIVRGSYLFANRCAVVSERCTDQSEEPDLASGIAFAAYDDLADRCVELVSDDEARSELAERGYQAFSARSQADILRNALSSMFG